MPDPKPYSLDDKYLLDDAQPLFEESLRILRRVYGENHPEIVTALFALGDAKERHRDFAGAEANLREALPIARVIYGQERPAIANVVSRLGGVLTNQRKLEEAEPLVRQAVAIRLKLLGESHPRRPVGPGRSGPLADGTRQA